MTRTVVRTGAFLLLCFALATNAWGQAGQLGSLTGTVSDASGGAMPGVTVTVKNAATNVTSTAVTSAAGVYLIPSLVAGRYTVSFELSSFVPDRREIEVRTGERLQIDVTLKVGGLAEQVTIVSDTPLLQTSTATRGTVIDSAVIDRLPLGTRNPYTNLVMLSPGVVGETNNLQSLCCRPFDNGGMDNIAINGGVSRSNSFTLNGATNTVREGNNNGNLGFVPSPDAVEEVRIDTNSVDASQGRNGGGTVAVTVRSGTNNFRTTSSLNYRPKTFNQNILANRLSGTAKPNIHLYDGAVTFGGPVALPRLYNGKDKTFFFYSYEYWHSAEAAASNARVPTELERLGNFSQSINGVAGGNIFDPFNGRQQFAGNIIPANRMNPLALAYMNYYPLPTRDVDVNNQNYTFGDNQRGDRYYSTLGRVDHNVGNSRLMASYGLNRRKEIRADNGIVFEATGTSRHYRLNNVLNVEYTMPLGGTSVQKIAAGWTNHYRHDDAGGEEVGFDSTELGYPASLVNGLPRRFIGVSGNGMINLGGSAGLKQKSNDYYFQYELTQLKGRHSFKYGVDYRALRDFNAQALGGVNFGSFAFNRNFTSNVAGDNPGTAAGGNAFASFMLGIPAFSTTNAAAGGQVTLTPESDYHGGYVAAYIQDDFRVSRRFTVNLGLRWDYDPTPGEKNNQIIKGFDASVASPFVCAPCAAAAANIAAINGVVYSNPALANFKGGILFPDSNPWYERDLNNFGPRVGGTFQLTEKVLARGSYGLTYLPRATDNRQTGGVFSKATPLVTSIDGGITPVGTYLNTAWNTAYAEGLLPITGSAQGLLASIGNGFTYEGQDRSLAMFHSYQGSVQIQTPWRSVLDIAFVGSRTNGIGRNEPINDVPLDLARQLSVPDPLTPTQTLAQRAVANPFRGLVPDNPTLNRATTTTLQNLLRPFPQYNAAITQAGTPNGFQRYKAFQVSWEKRLSHGLSGLIAYTGSRTTEATRLNQGDPLTTQLTSQNRPHVLKLTGAYTVPSMDSRAPLVRWALGGWTVSTITTVRSGAAVDMPDTVDIIGDYILSDATYARSFNTCTLLADGVTRQNCADPGTADATRAGDITRQPLAPAWQVRGVGAPDTTYARLEGVQRHEPFYLDFSFGKAVRMSSRALLRIQVDLYNAGGVDQFDQPNRTVNGETFGRTTITSQNNDPRKAQLTIKLSY